MGKARWILLAVLTASLLPTGCGRKYEAYGVLLWSDGGSRFRTGDVVPIVRAYPRTGTVEIEAGEATRELPAWRFRVSAAEEEASAFAAEYQAYLRTYAYAKKSGLPVRSDPSQKSDTVYRLKENQVIKIIDRGDRMSQEGVYENYWYEVLTEDGCGGYSFGELLATFETDSDPFARAAALQSEDRVLDAVMSRIWRPEYFMDMIRDRRYDFERFRSDIGFFPESSENRIRIKTEDADRLFAYQRVSKIGAATYEFTGTDLRIEVMAADRLVASFKENGKLVSLVFLLLPRDVLQVIRDEQERRRGLYADFAGRTFRSASYGTIRFREDTIFDWRDYNRLVPAVLPADFSGAGDVEFPYYLGASVSREYEGIITFRFAGRGEEGRRSFLYRRVGGGMTLVYVRPSDIDALVVPAVGVSPLILFFEELVG